MKWRYPMHLFASLGEFWLARDNPVKALEFINRCLDIATRTNSRKYIVSGRRFQGQAELMMGNHLDTQQSLEKALALAQAIANPTQLWKTHLAWGQLHEARKRRDMAQQSYRAARSVLDQVKATVQTPDLRANLGHAPMMQQVYDLSQSEM